MLTITNEDNMELMARYPDKHFDLAIVDPPYGMTGNVFRTKDKKFTNGMPSAGLNSIRDVHNNVGERPGSDYFKELFRVSKNQIIFGMQYFVEHLKPHQCVLIWEKPNGTNRLSDAELAWTSFDRGVRIINRYWGGVRIHPTQKPVDVYRYILQEFAVFGDKILDTHMGSGSIAIVCHDYGFDLTACELDKKYFDSAMKRINDHISQTKLF